MPDPDDQIRDVVSTLASALQVAGPRAARLRVMIGKAYEDAIALDAVLERAKQALDTLKPGSTPRT